MDIREIEIEIKKKERELEDLRLRKSKLEVAIENNVQTHDNKFYLYVGGTGKVYYHVKRALDYTNGYVKIEGESFTEDSTMQTISNSYCSGLMFFNPSEVAEIEPNAFYRQLRIARAHINDTYSKGKICENCKYYSDVNMACMNPIMEGARTLPYSSMCVNNEAKEK